MPGQYYKLLIPRTKLDFSALGISQSQSVFMKRYIDVSQYRELTLVVRVHALNITNTGNIQVLLFAEGPTTEDPVYDAYASGLWSGLQLTSSIVAPTLTLASPVLLNVGSSVAIQVVGSQGTSAGTVTATISVDVAAKS